MVCSQIWDKTFVNMSEFLGTRNDADAINKQIYHVTMHLSRVYIKNDEYIFFAIITSAL